MKSPGWRMLLASALAVLVPGCAALIVGAAAGAGGAVYFKGRLEEVIGKPVPQLHEAAQKGLKDLGLPLVMDRADKLSAEMKSGLADGKDIWISIKWVSETSSKISIRVGYIGDQARSIQILDAIKKRL